MREEINQKINLARLFMRKRDYRKALAVLQEAEQLVLQTPNYPYWAALTRLLEDSHLAFAENPPAGDAPASAHPADHAPAGAAPADQAASPPPAAPAPAGPAAAHNPDNSLLLMIEGEDGRGDLSPSVMARDVLPFVQALEGLQRAINAALGAPNQPVIVRHIGQNGQPCLEASGLEQAVRAMRLVIAPWRASNAALRQAWARDRDQFAKEIARARSQLARVLLSALPQDNPQAVPDTGRSMPDTGRSMPDTLLPPLDVLMLGPVSFIE